jgi:glycerophosphoryl diester phosphodiesterase
MHTMGTIAGNAALCSRFFDRFAAQPLLIAHRGYRSCYPENTLCAFEQSLGRSRMIELDVQLTADGVAVVFHDRYLTRTFNAEFIAREVGLASLALCDWRLEQLRLLDLGTWFIDSDPFATLRRGLVDRHALLSLMPQRILTLRELLDWAGTTRMPLNIEIKDMRHTRMNDLIVPEVIREIRSAEITEDVVISSFNHQYLRTCRRLAPEIATAALRAGPPPLNLITYLRELGVCAYHPEDAQVDEALVKTLRAAGLHVNVFTVNDPSRQQQLFRFGVTGIFTDFLASELPMS